MNFPLTLPGVLRPGAATARRSDPASTRVLATIVGVWVFLWAFQSAASLGEAARRGGAVDVAGKLAFNALNYLPWVLFSLVLFSLLERRRDTLADVRRVLRLLAGSTLLFYLPDMVYEVALDLHRMGKPWSALPTQLFAYPLNAWFIEYILFLGCFASLYAVAVFREGLATERRKQRVESENLGLRLEVEHQRLMALQAQLEPHFLFNALNAISGLVRAEDKRGALGGLARLSELLRYALAATGREHVTLGEEIDFVRDYLSLQQLRYGERLNLRVAGETDAVRGCVCPPLLLQPLLENALRHDLDCHQGASEMRLHFQLDGERLHIALDNPLRDALPPNPGLGLGLRNTRERIELLYRGRARIETGARDGRFEVRLSLPADTDDDIGTRMR